MTEKNKTETISALDLAQNDEKPKPDYIYFNPEKIGVSTLYNLGNTCFFNSIIQCLAHTEPLRKYILQSGIVTNDQLFTEFSRLLKVMWKDNFRLSPHTVYKLFCLEKKKFDNEQEDSHEILIFLLDKFHEALKSERTYGDLTGEQNPAIKESLQQLQKIQMSPINDIFMGQFCQSVVCDKCRHVSSTYPTFNNIQLNFPVKGNKYLDIYDLINRLVHTEILENCYNCDNCNQKGVTAYKQTTFWRLPDVLIIQFVRFNFEQQKNSRFVDYPILNLNMNRYVTNSNAPNYIYDLSGVSCHLGTVQAGHYWSICKANNYWIVLDDESQKYLSSPDDVVIGSSKHNNYHMRNFGPTAYILFYQRK